MITWTFEGLETFFKSRPENLSRDISKMAYANNLDPETKTIIIDGDTNHTFSTNDLGSNGDSSSATQSALPVDAEELTCPEPETNELPSVFSDMDDADPNLDLLG
jgi:hypothetical protein